MRNILVIRFSSLGDIILTEPVVQRLKTKYPQATITYLVKERFAPALRMFQHVDEVAIWRSDDSPQLIAALKRIRFDLVVDLHSSLRSLRVRTLLQGKKVATDKQWLKRIASVRFKSLKAQPSHALERYLSSVADLGISQAPSPPRLVVPADANAWWQQHRERSYFIIAAGATHPAKRAPDELWQRLVPIANAQFRLRPLLLGAPGERAQLLHLAKALAVPAENVISESDICRAAAAIKAARFVISNDSGLAHLAAAIETPVVALFGPTHPVLGFAPLGERAETFTVNEHCSPCSLHGERACYRKERFCFTRMLPQAIVDLIAELLRR